MTKAERPLGSWDQQFANDLIGQVVLVGITKLNPAGEPIEQTQFVGHVTSVDSRVGIELSLTGKRAGETYTLPPDTRVFQRAASGSYTLRSTGEVVEDPDLICSWTSRARADA